MKIDAKLVAQLRKETGGVGMADCKAALLENDGDIEKAKVYLRKQGLAKAQSKDSRVAAEGYIAIVTSKEAAVMLEINCETDFVANNDAFIGFAETAAKYALDHSIDSVEKLSQSEEIEAKRQELIMQLGEKVQIRKLIFAKAQGEFAFYRHGSKIGVLVDFNGVESAGKDIAMHIAACNPSAVAIDRLPKEVVEREKDICKAQAGSMNKPPEIIEKILDGKLKKTLGEMCLLNQPFVKDSGMSVEQYLSDNKSTVNEFYRVVVGAGIEKKEENFAEEVKKQRGN